MLINESMIGKITMADVAREAGVHQTTVSLALRNDRRLAEETRVRIRAIAERMGYRPNPLVSALIAERKKGMSSEYGSTLAFLTTGKTRDRWRQSRQYVNTYEAMIRHAEARGYKLAEFWLDEPGMTGERLAHILLHRGIRGIIVCPVQVDRRSLAFDFSSFAAVAIGYALQSPLLDHVAVDLCATMRLVVQELEARGFRRIGFVTPGDTSNRVNHLSLGAFLAERHNAPRRFIRPLVAAQWERSTVMNWLRQTEPDVVILPTQSSIISLKRWLLEEGVSVPGFLSLVCLDCHRHTDDSGILQDLETEASAIIEFVTGRVQRASFGIPSHPQTILVGGVWREGRTCLHQAVAKVK